MQLQGVGGRFYEAVVQQRMTGEAFSDAFSVDWYRVPVEAETLNRLMERSDLRGWIQTIPHLGLFFLTAALAYAVFLNVSAGNWYWSVPLLFLALFAHGTMGPFMGLIAIHELQHRTVFRTRWLNEFFEKVYAFISWSDYIWYQESHRRHHRATCFKAADGEIVLPQRFHLRHPAFWISILGWYPKATWQRLQRTWQHANGIVEGEWYRHVLPETDVRLRRRHRNWARMLLLGHGLLVVLFVLTGHWFLIVVFTIGTQYCGWLGFLTAVPQHLGMDPEIPDFRENSRTFTCSPLLGFYYWNMQYHAEHHMYPAVPFHKLPALRDEIEADMPPAPHGLVATWREILERADPADLGLAARQHELRH